MKKHLIVALFSVTTLVACEQSAETVSNSESASPDANPMPPVEEIVSSKQLPVIDPDTGKADALGVGHSGADPHATLTAEQQINVALQHRAEGRIPEALIILDQALDKFPQSAQIHAVRSDIRRDRQDLAGALADIERAVDLNPQSAAYLVQRSQLYLSFERVQEAQSDLDKAVEMEPDLIPARFNRGTLHAHNGDYAAALVDLDACVAIDPHLAAPYFNRGSVYYNMGRQQEAVADMQRFIELADAESWKQSARDLLKAWQETGGEAQEQEEVSDK